MTFHTHLIPIHFLLRVSLTPFDVGAERAFQVVINLDNTRYDMIIPEIQYNKTDLTE